MNKTAVNSLLAIGVALGTSAISALPAAAQVWSFGSTAAGSNLWCPNTGQAIDPMKPATASLLCPMGTSLDTLLQGSPGNPGGNVELGTDAILSVGTNFETLRTTLNGTVNGHAITFSSLIKSDWTNNGNALAKKFLGEAITANGIGLGSNTLDDVVNYFISSGGARRFSNPNIEYVNAGPGEYTVGLAGVLNASTILQGLFPSGVTIPSVVQASEVVKVGNDYLYSFKALNSGLSTVGPLAVCTGAAATGVTDPKAVCSHTGDYAITVPEPSSLLGLLVMGGGLLAVKRGKKS